MKIEMTKRKIRMLLKSYKGHIEQDVSYKDCKPKEHNCPIHKFFNDLKKELKSN